MSIWTHVAAVIRVDCFKYGEDDESNEDRFNFDALVGKEIHFNDDKEKWEYAREHKDEFMPFGSEGGLTKLIWENPNKNTLPTYTITIFGDLRDYDQLDEILEWFKKVCDRFHIRQACITCNDGYNVKTLDL